MCFGQQELLKTLEINNKHMHGYTNKYFVSSHKKVFFFWVYLGPTTMKQLIHAHSSKKFLFKKIVHTFIWYTSRFSNFNKCKDCIHVIEENVSIKAFNLWIFLPPNESCPLQKKTKCFHFWTKFYMRIMALSLHK